MAAHLPTLAVTLCAAVLLASGAAACGDAPRSGPAVVAGQPVGQVEAVTGSVRVVRAGQERPVRVGEPISGDDEVHTGADGHIAVVLWHNQVTWQVGPGQRRVVGESLAWRAPRAAAVAAGADVVSAPAGRHVEREAADTSASARDEAAAAGAAVASSTRPRAMVTPTAPDLATEERKPSEPTGRAGPGRGGPTTTTTPSPDLVQPEVVAGAGEGGGAGGGGVLERARPVTGADKDDDAGKGDGKTEAVAATGAGSSMSAAKEEPAKGKRRPTLARLTSQVRSGPLDAAAAQATLVRLQASLGRCALAPAPVTLVINVRADGTVAALSGTTATGAALAAAAVRCARAAVSAAPWPGASAASTLAITVR
ncbi:MAG: hypothetical protein KA297_01700 [Kofleriaceae bacterium]|nr:hypothetical protein [Kofleriaceae bacterium]